MPVIDDVVVVGLFIVILVGVLTARSDHLHQQIVFDATDGLIVCNGKVIVRGGVAIH